MMQTDKTQKPSEPKQAQPSKKSPKKEAVRSTEKPTKR